MQIEENIVQEYLNFLRATDYPCVGAKASLARDQIKCMVATHMACPAADIQILEFLYAFIDDYRKSDRSFHSAAVIFTQPNHTNESMFDALLWQRLKALALLDKQKYLHDKRVDSDPASAMFSFSLKEEALFIIGLHPGSSRRSRQFNYPALVFNPHAEFEKLRKANRYEQIKKIVRNRDLNFSGSTNPMLRDFSEASEVFQYSGMQYSHDWKCPLIDQHEANEHNPTS